MRQKEKESVEKWRSGKERARGKEERKRIKRRKVGMKLREKETVGKVMRMRREERKKSEEGGGEGRKSKIQEKGRKRKK